MTFTKEQISLAIKIIEESADAETFKQKFEANKGLAAFDSEEVALKLIQEGKVEYLKVLMDNGLHTSTRLGEPKGSISSYLIDNKTLNRRIDFIALLLHYDAKYFRPDQKLNQFFGNALHAAIDQNNLSLFKDLASKSHFSSLIVENGEGKTPFMHAVLSKKLEFAEALFDKKTLPNKKKFFTNLSESCRLSNSTSGHPLKPMFDIAEKSGSNFSSEWKNFLKDLFDTIDKCQEGSISSYINPIISFCLLETEPELLKLIINSGILKLDTIHSKHSDLTVAMEAANSNNIALLSILKEAGEKFDFKNSGGFTAAHYVRSVEAANIVFTDENKNHKNLAGNSPLINIIISQRRFVEDENFLKLLEHLIDDSSIDLIDKSVPNSVQGLNILHALSYVKISENIDEQKFNKLANKIFSRIQNDGNNILQLLTQENNTSRTPLQFAFDIGGSALFKILLEQENKHGAASIVDRYLLEYAIFSGRKGIVECILSQEAGSKNAIPGEILMDIAKDFEENRSSLITSSQERDCLALLNNAVKKPKKNIEVGQKKIYGRITFSEFCSLSKHIESGSMKEVTSILSKAGPASRIILSSVLKSFQNQLRDNPSISAEQKQCIDLLADTVKKLENPAKIQQAAEKCIDLLADTAKKLENPAKIQQAAENSKNVNNSDKSKVNEKKSLAEYFRSFINWVKEGLRKMYDFLTGNVPKKAGTTVNSEKNNEKPGAPGTTPTVDLEVKKSTKK